MLDAHESQNRMDADKSMTQFRRYPRFYYGEDAERLVALLLHVRPLESATITQELRRMRDLYAVNVQHKSDLEDQLTLLQHTETDSMEEIEQVITQCLKLEEKIKNIKYGDIRDLKVLQHVVDTLPLVPMGFPPLPPEMMLLILKQAQIGGNPRQFASVSRYFRQVYRDNPDLFEEWMRRDRWIRPVPILSTKMMVGLNKIVFTHRLKDGRYMLVTSGDDVMVGMPGVYLKSIGKVPFFVRTVSKDNVLYMTSNVEVFRFSEATGIRSLYRSKSGETVNGLYVVQNNIYFTTQSSMLIGALFRLDDDDQVHVIETEYRFCSLVAVSESMFVFYTSRNYMIYARLDHLPSTCIATIDLDVYNPRFNYSTAGATTTTVLITLYTTQDPGEIIIEYDAIKNTCTPMHSIEHTRSFGTNHKDMIVAIRYDSYAVWDDETRNFLPPMVFSRVKDDSFYISVDTHRHVHVVKNGSTGETTFMMY